MRRGAAVRSLRCSGTRCQTQSEGRGRPRAAVPPVDPELSRAGACPSGSVPGPSSGLSGSEASCCSLLRTPPPAMAPLLALLLAALVGLPLAQALDCHVCSYNGENCFNPMRCPSMVTYCMTTRTYYTPTRMKVSKSCVPSCFETVYDGYSKHASTTVCCQYDLCNGGGLATPGTLALAPVLLATLWGLL